MFGKHTSNQQNMRQLFSAFCVLIMLSSCIPLRVAPDIDDYKVTSGKKFKRGLPKREMFVFEDPKDADQFYYFVDIKYGLNGENVYDDVPFEVNGETYFFSFYEIEIPNKTLNLFPVVFDVFLNGALGNEDFEPMLSDGSDGLMRNGNWYIAIEAYSDREKDCLHPNSLSREAVLKYLSTLKKEYLSTHNYNEVVFKN